MLGVYKEQNPLFSALCAFVYQLHIVVSFFQSQTFIMFNLDIYPISTEDRRSFLHFYNYFVRNPAAASTAYYIPVSPIVRHLLFVALQEVNIHLPGHNTQPAQQAPPAPPAPPVQQAPQVQPPQPDQQAQQQNLLAIQTLLAQLAANAGDFTQGVPVPAANTWVPAQFPDQGIPQGEYAA